MYLWKARATARENQSGSMKVDKLGETGIERNYKTLNRRKREHKLCFPTGRSFSSGKVYKHSWITSSFNSYTVVLYW